MKTSSASSSQVRCHKRLQNAGYLTMLIDHLPYLKRLNIGGFYRLTGWGIKQLVTGLPHLEELVLSGCPKVHYDAIEWARKKLKRVDWTPVQEARSGRRVLWG